MEGIHTQEGIQEDNLFCYRNAMHVWVHRTRGKGNAAVGCTPAEQADLMRIASTQTRSLRAKRGTSGEQLSHEARVLKRVYRGPKSLVGYVTGYTQKGSFGETYPNLSPRYCHKLISTKYEFIINRYKKYI